MFSNTLRYYFYYRPASFYVFLFYILYTHKNIYKYGIEVHSYLIRFKKIISH